MIYSSHGVARPAKVPMLQQLNTHSSLQRHACQLQTSTLSAITGNVSLLVLRKHDHRWWFDTNSVETENLEIMVKV